MDIFLAVFRGRDGVKVLGNLAKCQHIPPMLPSHPELTDVLRGVASTALANVRATRFCLDKTDILKSSLLHSLR
jgi:hypothetical protein